MAVLWYGCYGQEYWLFLPVLGSKYECIIMLRVICSVLCVYLLLGSWFVLFWQDGCGGSVLTGFLGAVKVRLPLGSLLLGRRLWMLLGLRLLHAGQRGSWKGLDSRIYANTIKSCCWKTLMCCQWAGVWEPHDRQVASLSSLRLFLPGDEELLADLSWPKKGRSIGHWAGWMLEDKHEDTRQRETWGRHTASWLSLAFRVCGVWNWRGGTLMTQQASAQWHACFSPLMLGLPSLQCCSKNWNRNHFLWAPC